MGKHTVLYLSYDGMTDPLGQSQVIPYLRALSKKGYEIHLVTFEKAEKKTFQVEIQQELNHANIIWHPISYTAKPPVLSTLYDIFRLFKKVATLHKQYDFELVHCRSYITALVGRWMQKKFNTKFLFDMRGFFADERLDGGIWQLSNPVFKLIYQFFKKQEKIFFAEADHVVSLTYGGKGIIEQDIMQNKDSSPISVIPCCADTGLFHPENVSESEKMVYRERLNIKANQVVIGYLGSIGTWYMLPEMLDFFRIMHIKKPDAIFMFVTKESPKEILDLAKQKGISTSSFRIVSANRREVPIFLSLITAGIFFIKPVFSKKASSPTKQGEMMSMGLPVICNSGVGDSDQIVKKYNSGVLVNEFNELAYQTAMQEFEKNNWASPNSIRNGAIDYFALEKGVQTYANIYRELIGEPKEIKSYTKALT